MTLSNSFGVWVPLLDLAVNHFRRDGEFAAVYVMRDKTTETVLKYGSTGCLRARILGNYIGGIGGATTQRIHGELFTNGMIRRVEIAWIERQDEVTAKAEETRLRQIYKSEHGGKRPLWDLRD